MKIKNILCAVVLCGTSISTGALTCAKKAKKAEAYYDDVTATLSADSMSKVSTTVTGTYSDILWTDVFKSSEYYDGKNFVLLTDKDYGFDKRPIAEYYRGYMCGPNNSDVFVTYKLVALYKNPISKSKNIKTYVDVANSDATGLRMSVEDAVGGSLSSTVTSKIGVDFGGFVEAGVEASMCAEYGFEIGTSLETAFTYNESYKSSNSRFELNCYEMHSDYLVVMYTPKNVNFRTYTPTKTIHHKFLFIEWDEEVQDGDSYKVFESINYTREVYYINNLSEVVFDYETL